MRSAILETFPEPNRRLLQRYFLCIWISCFFLCPHALDFMIACSDEIMNNWASWHVSFFSSVWFYAMICILLSHLFQIFFCNWSSSQNILLCHAICLKYSTWLNLLFKKICSLIWFWGYEFNLHCKVANIDQRK